MVDLGVRQRHLYSAVKRAVMWVGPNGDERTSGGTGFLVGDGGPNVALITNRHVVDPRYADPKWIGYTTEGLRATGLQMENGTPTRISLGFERPMPIFNDSDETADVALVPVIRCKVGGIASI